MKRRIGSGLLIVATLAGQTVAAADENLFPGGDCEAATEASWRKPVGKGVWSFEDGKGRGGSRALVLTVTKPERETWRFSEPFPVEPGTVYRLTGWVKDLEGDKFRVGVGVVWLDANGKRIDERGAKRLTDNDIKQDGWCRIEMETPPLPANAVSCEIYAGVGQRHLGTSYIDDLVLVQTASKPEVTRLYTSAYRDMAAAGEVRLAATYFASPVKYPEAKLRGAFQIETPDGVRRFPAKLADGVATGSFDAAELKEGTHPITFALGTHDGQVFGRKTLDFTKVRELPKRRVAIDDRMRTVVDGKPFFPLGMYWPKVTQERLDVYTNSPFNFIMPYNDTRRESLDLCHKAGIMVACHLSGCACVARLSPEKREAAERHYTDEMMSLKDHPAVLAWYLADELHLDFAAFLAARHRNFHAIDPDHPTWIVLDKVRHVRGLMDGFDVIGVDPYPIGNRGWPTETTLALPTEWTRQTAEAMFGFRPMWIVPQAFDWSWYPKGKEKAMAHVEKRLPTRAELSGMTWQAIAAGANGLCYYSFGSLLGNLKGAAFDAAWADVVAVAHEVKTLESILLSDPGPVLQRVPKGLVARTWAGGPEDHLLVVNSTSESVKAELALPFANVNDPLKFDLSPLGHRIFSFPR